jgi:hypothetical protein
MLPARLADIRHPHAHSHFKDVAVKLPAPKLTHECYGAGSLHSVGHAPDLSKLMRFDFMCYILHGAWRSFLATSV